MSGNKRQDDASLLVAQLAGVLAVAFVFAPMLRELVLVGVVLCVGTGFGIILYWANNSQSAQPRPGAENPSPVAAQVAVPAEEPTQSLESLPAAAAIADRGGPELAAPPDIHLSPPELTVSSSIVSRLHSIDPHQFEKIMEVTCRDLGYSVTRGDGGMGIDLVVENQAGRSAMHCRHWNAGDVKVEAVREFAQALASARMERGVFLTAGGVPASAKRVAAEHGIEILDGTGLESLLRAAGAENSAEIQALLNQPRKVCPECESELVLCSTSEADQAGFRFWSCSTRPKCQYTLPLL